jgi:hypothetical protein
LLKNTEREIGKGVMIMIEDKQFVGLVTMSNFVFDELNVAQSEFVKLSLSDLFLYKNVSLNFVFFV